MSGQTHVYATHQFGTRQKRPTNVKGDPHIRQNYFCNMSKETLVKDAQNVSAKRQKRRRISKETHIHAKNMSATRQKRPTNVKRIPRMSKKTHIYAKHTSATRQKRATNVKTNPRTSKETPDVHVQHVARRM